MIGIAGKRGCNRDRDGLLDAVGSQGSEVQIRFLEKPPNGMWVQAGWQQCVFSIILVTSPGCYPRQTICISEVREALWLAAACEMGDQMDGCFVVLAAASVHLAGLLR